MHTLWLNVYYSYRYYKTYFKTHYVITHLQIVNKIRILRLNTKLVKYEIPRLKKLAV